MNITINTVHEDLLKMKRELDFIKMILMSEGELTPWAKKALNKARARPESEYVSLEETKKRILSRR